MQITKALITSAAAAIMLCGHNQAQAAPPTISASMAQAFTIDINCSETTCTNLTKVILSGSHSIELTETQESTLQTSTAISVSLDGSAISFELGEDPNFQNGDKSANIKKQQTVPEGSDILTAKAKWGNGRIDINVKRTVNIKSDSPALTKETKALNTQTFETTINTPAQPSLTVGLLLACDEKVSQKVSTTAEGATQTKLIQSLKSKFIVEP